MDAPNPKIAELEQLLWRMRDGAIDDDGLARIETLVTGDAEVRRFYIRYSTLCGGLRWLNAGEAGQRLFSPPAVENAPSTPFPSLSTTRYPLPATDFVGSWTFACMVATVIVGAMILGAWAVKVTHHQHFATAPSKSVPSDARPEFVFVGRITGLLDVKWSDDKDFLPPHGYAYVPLGHKYKLDSGLMEITYDTGAKVILQGPCTYEVESSSGGYLALGKLTARVGAVEGKGSSSKVQGSRSTSLTTSHQPLATNSNPQSLIPNPLFAIRTPTAIVTDLGTEFGVEVSEEGTTTSHVFRGSVKVLVLDADGNLPSPSGRGAGGEGSGREVILGENESVRVQHDKDAEDRLVVVRGPADTASFVRAGQLAQVVEERRRLGPLRRWQTFSEELRKRDDLLAYYDFQPDEKDRTVLRNRAATGAALDGRIENAPWVSGRFPDKHALQFGRPGSGVRVNIPVECKQLTVAAWVKLDRLPTAAEGLAGLLMSDGWSRNDSFTGRIAWQMRYDGRIFFTLDNWNDNTISWSVLDNARVLDHWRHLAVVYVYDPEASRVAFYLDGEHVGEGDMTALAHPTMAATIGPATIGAWDSRGAVADANDNRRLHGAIDEMMIFSAALSPEEIRRLFERGVASAVEKGAATATEKKGEQPMNGP